VIGSRFEGDATTRGLVPRPSGPGGGADSLASSGQAPPGNLESRAVGDLARPFTLRIRAFDHGFFGNFNCVVNHLVSSLGRNGCQALTVDWRVPETTREFPYARPEDGNLWDRLFEPLRFPDAPSHQIVTAHFVDLSITNRWVYRTYKSGGRWRRTYHEAFRRHIRLRSDVARDIDAMHEATMKGRRCIGVHVRHPAKQELPRRQASTGEMIAMAKQQLRRRDDRVVLATDHVETVLEFQDALGEQLVMQEHVYRSATSEQQSHFEAPVPSVEIAKQVLTDAVLLSRCAVLVHQVSNVATAVGYMNPSMRMLYCEPRRDHLANRLIFGTPVGRVVPRTAVHGLFGTDNPQDIDPPAWGLQELRE